MSGSRLPLRPPDFVALLEPRGRDDEALPAGVWDTVLYVQSHCWSAQARLLAWSDDAGRVAEVWLRHRQSARAVFAPRAEFQFWYRGARTNARVIVVV
ncbi:MULTISPECIES: hypothetical protein [unclassified Dyella]|uniref:hypothetical protein n=1 Tax=unclassified Dyella TaxID=2634549 RepID=UPI003F8DE4B6